MNPGQQYRLVFLGPPGIGKGTQCDLLSSQYNFLKISAGHLLRRVQNSESLLGQYISSNWSLKSLEPLVIEMMEDQILEAESRNQGFVVESLTELNSAVHFSDFLNKIGTSFDLVFLMNIPDLEPSSLSILCSRMAKRWVHTPSGRTYNEETNPPKVEGKDDETGEPLEQRLDDIGQVMGRVTSWINRTGDIIEFFKNQGILRVINGMESIQNVFSQVEEILNSEEIQRTLQEKRKKEVKNLNVERFKPLAEPLNKVFASVAVCEGCAVIQALMNTINVNNNKFKLKTRNARFPGTLTNCITQENKIKLEEQPYSAALKLDGTRFILVVLNSKCYFIGRKLDVMRLKIKELPIYDGTILDGELMECDGTFFYFVFDAISVGEKNVMTLPFSDRLSRAAKVVEFLEESFNPSPQITKSSPSKQTKKQDKSISKNAFQLLGEGTKEKIVDEKVEPNSTTLINFKLQDFHPIYYTKHLFDDMKRSQFKTVKTDGIIFMPENDFYTRYKLNENILKWKSVLESTLDVCIKVLSHDPPLSQFLVAYYTEGRAELVPFFQDDGTYQTSDDPELLKRDGKIVECSWDPTTKKWSFSRERNDKSLPNVDWVAKRLWNSLQNPVSKEDLIKFTEKIRTTPSSTRGRGRGGRFGEYEGRGRGRGRGGRSNNTTPVKPTTESEKSTSWRRPLDFSGGVNSPMGNTLSNSAGTRPSDPSGSPFTNSGLNANNSGGLPSPRGSIVLNKSVGATNTGGSFSPRNSNISNKAQTPRDFTVPPLSTPPNPKKNPEGNTSPRGNNCSDLPSSPRNFGRGGRGGRRGQV